MSGARARGRVVRLLELEPVVLKMYVTTLRTTLALLKILISTLRKAPTRKKASTSATYLCSTSGSSHLRMMLIAVSTKKAQVRFRPHVSVYPQQCRKLQRPWCYGSSIPGQAYRVEGKVGGKDEEVDGTCGPLMITARYVHNLWDAK